MTGTARNFGTLSRQPTQAAWCCCAVVTIPCSCTRQQIPQGAMLNCLRADLGHERHSTFQIAPYHALDLLKGLLACSAACTCPERRRGLLGSAQLLTRSILRREWVSQAMNWRSPSTMAAVPYWLPSLHDGPQTCHGSLQPPQEMQSGAGSTCLLGWDKERRCLPVRQWGLTRGQPERVLMPHTSWQQSCAVPGLPAAAAGKTLKARSICLVGGLRSSWCCIRGYPDWVPLPDKCCRPRLRMCSCVRLAGRHRLFQQARDLQRPLGRQMSPPWKAIPSPPGRGNSIQLPVLVCQSCKQQNAPAPKHGTNVEAGQISDVVRMQVGHKHLQGRNMSKAAQRSSMAHRWRSPKQAVLWSFMRCGLGSYGGCMAR